MAATAARKPSTVSMTSIAACATGSGTTWSAVSPSVSVTRRSDVGEEPHGIGGGGQAGEQAEQLAPALDGRGDRVGRRGPGRTQFELRSVTLPGEIAESGGDDLGRGSRRRAVDRRARREGVLEP